MPLYAFGFGGTTQTANGGSLPWAFIPSPTASTGQINMPPYPLTSYALSSPVGLEVYPPGIPAWSTILGIQLRINLYSSVPNVARDVTVQILNGTTPGVNRAMSAVIGTNDITTTYGSPTDLWGLSWTPADILNLDWSLQIAGTGNAGTVYVDGVGVFVYTSGFVGGGMPVIPPYAFAAL